MVVPVNPYVAGRAGVLRVLCHPQTNPLSSTFGDATDTERSQFIFVIGRNIGDLDAIALSLFKGAPSWRISLLNHKDTAELTRLSKASGHALEWLWDGLPLP